VVRIKLAFGVNFIHNNINTSNNRPTNGQFTFNGQVTVCRWLTS